MKNTTTKVLCSLNRNGFGESIYASLLKDVFMGLAVDRGMTVYDQQSVKYVQQEMVIRLALSDTKSFCVQQIDRMLATQRDFGKNVDARITFVQREATTEAQICTSDHINSTWLSNRDPLKSNDLLSEIRTDAKKVLRRLSAIV